MMAGGKANSKEDEKTSMKLLLEDISLFITSPASTGLDESESDDSTIIPSNQQASTSPAATTGGSTASSTGIGGGGGATGTEGVGGGGGPRVMKIKSKPKKLITLRQFIESSTTSTPHLPFASSQQDDVEGFGTAPSLTINGRKLSFGSTSAASAAEPATNSNPDEELQF